MQARMPPSRSVTAGRKVCSVRCGWSCGMACCGMARHGLSCSAMASSLRGPARERGREVGGPYPARAEAYRGKGKMASRPHSTSSKSMVEADGRLVLAGDAAPGQ